MKTHLKIIRVVDGDGFIVCDLFNEDQEEIRLLGIDAPEIKPCKKLFQDERETNLPGQLLMQLGYRSMHYLISLLPVNSNITLLIQKNYPKDIYGRTLAYAFNSRGECINEIMISEGFAKPYERFSCGKQYEYQMLFNAAKTNKKGLFETVSNF